MTCPSCGAPAYSVDAVQSYFSQSGCPGCGTHNDNWRLVLEGLAFEWPLGGGLAPALVGARGVAIRMELEPSEVVSIDFETFGLPQDARVVSVNYTPVGGSVFPVELHGNQPDRRFPKQVSLYGRPIGSGAHQPTILNVFVTWIPSSQTDLNALASAVEAYSADRFSDVIVPANVAVESALDRLMADFLSSAVSSKRVDDFLAGAATYGHQLNVLLPALTRRLGIAQLPDIIRGKLNRLKALRNQLAHRGQLDSTPDRSETAACLCAAFFGVNYVRFVRPLLLSPASTSQVVESGSE